MARQGTSGLVGCQWDNNQLLLLHKTSEALSWLDIMVRETAPKAKQGPALLKPQCAAAGDPIQVWDWARRKPGANKDATFIGAGGRHIPAAETGQGIVRKHHLAENSCPMEQELFLAVAYDTVGKTKS